MRKSETKSPRTLRRVHAPSILVVSGQPAELDEFEQKAQTGEFQAVLGKVQLKPAGLDALPPVFAWQDGSWKATALTSKTHENVPSGFEQARSNRPVQVRRYRLKKGGKKLKNPDLELAAHLRGKNELNSLSFHLDHIFKGANSQWGGGGPTLDEPPVKSNGKNFAEQECFKRLGIGDGDGRPTGKDVTVVVVDNSPPVEEVCHKTIDFWLDLSQLNDKVPAPPKGKEAQIAPREGPAHLPTVPAFEVKQQNRQNLQNALPIGDMLPYHGLLIATLIRHIAPEATIVLVKVLDKEDEAAGTTITQALEVIHYLRETRAESNGRRIIGSKVIVNLSFGLFRSQAEEVDAPYMLAACQQFLTYSDPKRGWETLLIACSGNDSLPRHPQNPEEPAAYGYFADTPDTDTNVISVAATTPGKVGEYAWFSNQSNFGAVGYDMTLDVGEFTRNPPSRFVTWSGTSFATPVVVGAAAALMSAPQPVHADKVKQVLWQSRTQPADWNGVPEANLRDALASLRNEKG